MAATVNFFAGLDVASLKYDVTLLIDEITVVGALLVAPLAVYWGLRLVNSFFDGSFFDAWDARDLDAQINASFRSDGSLSRNYMIFSSDKFDSFDFQDGVYEVSNFGGYEILDEFASGEASSSFYDYSSYDYDEDADFFNFRPSSGYSF